MDSFLHFKQCSQLVSSIHNLTGPYKNDHISYTLEKQGQSISLEGSTLNSDYLLGQLNSILRFYNFDINATLTTLPSFNCSIQKAFVDNKLNVVTSIATHKSIYQKPIAPHLKNCLVSFLSTYNDSDYTIEGFLGIKTDKSMSTLVSVSNPYASVALRSFVTQKNNVLEASFFSLKYGPLSSIKGDVSTFALNKLKFGMQNQFQRFEGYGIIELIQKSIKIGLVSNLPNGISLACVSGYNQQKKKPKFIVGFRVPKVVKKLSTAFQTKLNFFGKSEMMVQFTPQANITVTFRSEACVRNKFENLVFGWSLDFK